MEQQNLHQAFRAAELIVAYLAGSLTNKEQQELDRWIEMSNENRLLFSELTNPVSLKESLNEFYLPPSKASNQK